MPRAPVVTYEQVAAVANSLFASGVKDPGTKAVRQELTNRAGGGPTGSPNTIQRHLDVWRQRDRPVDPMAFAELPEHLASTILGAMNQAAAVGREKVEQRLNQVQAELQELAASGEGAETRIDELTQDLAARTSERDSMQGQLSQRTAEVDELKRALAAATEKTSSLEVMLHAAQTEAQEASGRVDEIRNATDRQLAQMRAERDAAHGVQAEAERRVVVAEKESVAATARLEGERASKVTLETQLTELRQQVIELKSTVARLEPEAANAGAMAAEVAGLRRELGRQDDTISMLHGLVPKGDGAAGKPVAGESGTATKK